MKLNENNKMIDHQCDKCYKPTDADACFCESCLDKIKSEEFEAGRLQGIKEQEENA